MKNIKIIKPTLDDLEKVVEVEKASWPDIGEGMVAEVDKFKTRIGIGGMWMLYLDDKPAGVISFQNPSFTNDDILNKIYEEHHKKLDKRGGLLSWKKMVQKYGLPPTWYHATNDGEIFQNYKSTHNPKSNCAFLIGVGVDCKLKGNGLVNHLIAHTLKESRKNGKTHVLGYGRLPQLHESYTNPTIRDAEKHLLKLKPGTNLPMDYGARFHVNNGAKAVAVIPNAMDDPESCNFGFLALYKL